MHLKDGGESTHLCGGQLSWQLSLAPQRRGHTPFLCALAAEETSVQRDEQSYLC